MAVTSKDFSVWKLPLDQSEFDHHVSLAMIDVALRRMDRMLVTDEQHMVLGLIRNALVFNPAGVQVGNTIVSVVKGIQSGWRWTALLDTWIQFAEVYASWAWLSKNLAMHRFRMIGLTTQGDDARLITYVPGFGVALCEVMRAAGFDINPSKTWLSPVRDEFLRQVSTDEAGTHGYLNRALTAVMC
jgi:hypothetical protein